MKQHRFDCRRKVVLVTGASSGIGEAVAKVFANAGGKIALVGRNGEALERVRASILEKGGEAQGFIFDLNELKQIPALVKGIEGAFGDTAAILVNNAGIAVLGFVEHVPIEEYERNFRINVLAPLALIQAVIPSMKQKYCGQIINITSGVGTRGLPGASSYCMSKFALNAFTESVRVELAPFRISVISISPGLVQSRFAERLITYGPLKETYTEGSKRSAEDVAARILLASQREERDVVLAWRVKLARHLNYWAPRLFDLFLMRKVPR